MFATLKGISSFSNRHKLSQDLDSLKQNLFKGIKEDRLKNISNFIHSNQKVLFILGPVGCGKELLLEHFFCKSFPEMKFIDALKEGTFLEPSGMETNNMDQKLINFLKVFNIFPSQNSIFYSNFFPIACTLFNYNCKLSSIERQIKEVLLELLKTEGKGKVIFILDDTINFEVKYCLEKRLGSSIINNPRLEIVLMNPIRLSIFTEVIEKFITTSILESKSILAEINKNYFRLINIAQMKWQQQKGGKTVKVKHYEGQSGGENLTFFHKLGKLLYNKRVDSKGDTRVMSSKELLATPKPALNFKESDLLEGEDNLVKFSSFLSENVYDFFNDIGDLANALDVFSFSDSLVKRSNLTSESKYRAALLDCMATTTYNLNCISEKGSEMRSLRPYFVSHKQVANYVNREKDNFYTEQLKCPFLLNFNFATYKSNIEEYYILVTKGIKLNVKKFTHDKKKGTNDTGLKITAISHRFQVEKLEGYSNQGIVEMIREDVFSLTEDFD